MHVKYSSKTIEFSRNKSFVYNISKNSEILWFSVKKYHKQPDKKTNKHILIVPCDLVVNPPDFETEGHSQQILKGLIWHDSSEFCLWSKIICCTSQIHTSRRDFGRAIQNVTFLWTNVEEQDSAGRCNKNTGYINSPHFTTDLIIHEKEQTNEFRFIYQ